MDIRCGVHTGEVVFGETAGGIAVHIGARVAAKAGPGEVLVSSTVRDLVQGSGIGFRDRGAHVLKGVPGHWRLFAVADGSVLPADALLWRRLWSLSRSRRSVALAAAAAALLGLVGLSLLLRQRGPTAPGNAADPAAAGSPSPPVQATLGSADAPPSPDAARAIAVLPFRVVGPDRELWSEGMVDLLSIDLDGAVGLWAIDPRTVMSRWRREFDQESDGADRQAALRLARDVGARHALIGDMVAVGREVRLNVQLYDVETGKLEGEAQVNGVPDSIWGLVDRLAMEVLRSSFVQDAAALPKLDLRRATTSSVPALKAYLAGEQAFRRDHWPESVAAFNRALEADSTFAFVYYRLSLECSWEGNPECDPAVNYDSLAFQFADRLPERDAPLAKIDWLVATSGGSVAGALETLKRSTERYPDDAEAWFRLGDFSYHGTAPDWPLIPRDEALQYFRTALDLDPGMGPAYNHLINAAFAWDDSAEARRLVAGYRQIDSTSDRAIASALSFRLIFGGAAERARAVAALDTMRTEVLQRTLSVPGNWFGTCCLTSPGHWEQDLQIARALARPERPPDVRQAAWDAIGYIYSTRGRLREARDAFEKGGKLLRGTAGAILLGALAADADPELKRRAAEAVREGPAGPPGLLILGALAAREERWQDVERQVEELEAMSRGAGSAPDSIWFAAWVQALRGYSASVRGDRQAAIRAFTDALPYFSGTVTILLRLELGKAWLGEGDLQRAERYLRNVEFTLPAVNTPTEFYLGQAYEAMGNVPEAKLHYGRFVSWWKDCDPELRPMWKEGRRALERLTGLQKQ